jgi:YVTN family beta-propeller protein
MLFQSNFLSVLPACLLAALLFSGQTSIATEKAIQPDKDAVDDRVFTRKGVKVEFSASPQKESASGLMEGQFANISFNITGASDGAPVQGVYPGVWLDIAKAWSGKSSGAMNCKDRVSLYLQGTVGVRPMIDLNSYYILVMNDSDSISVIDPFVGVTGVTNLFTSIPLERPAGDWVKTEDQKLMYISMPRANKVAVADLDTFRVIENIDTGVDPLRVMLQPDQRYLWVAYNGEEGNPGGVTIIDTQTRRSVANIETGSGHHELAISSDNRFGYVSNRDSSTVTIIDTAKLKVIKQVEVGGMPISIDYSDLSKALYISDGETGIVTVVSGTNHAVLTRIKAEPGLGPLRFTDDDRWALAVNTAEDLVYAIDAGSNQVIHRIPVGDKPYQIGYTREFAYVRSLGTERVSMIYIPDLKKEGTPPVMGFSTGSVAPNRATSLSVADGMARAAQEAAIFIVNPGDNTVYYYMEGMNSPMGQFRNYGLRPRAVAIADRSLSESEPGVYSGIARMPVAGTYDVAFVMETPDLLHCFSLVVSPDPELTPEIGAVKIEYVDKQSLVTQGVDHRLLFQIKDAATGKPIAGIRDASVLYYRAPAFNRREVAAVEIDTGLYEALLPIPHDGAYYVYIAAPSRQLNFGDESFITLRTGKEKAMSVTSTAVVEN